MQTIEAWQMHQPGGMWCCASTALHKRAAAAGVHTRTPQRGGYQDDPPVFSFSKRMSSRYTAVLTAQMETHM